MGCCCGFASVLPKAAPPAAKSTHRPLHVVTGLDPVTHLLADVLKMDARIKFGHDTSVCAVVEAGGFR